MGSLRNEFDFHDMPHARQWADDFEQRIKAYEISADQIQRYNDSDYDTMADAIIRAISKIQENAMQGRKTLLLCFYAGNGATEKSTTIALLNSNKRPVKKR